MSSSDELRKRLEALNRGPLARPEGIDAAAEVQRLRRLLRKASRARHAETSDRQAAAPELRKGPAGTGPAPPIVFRRDLPRYQPAPPLIALGPHVELEEAVSDGAPAADGSGAYLVERRLTGAGGEFDALCEKFADAVSRGDSGLRPQLEYIGVAPDVRPDEMIFLDVETTGLYSTPLFLIGTMVWEAGGLVTRQYFARDYSQEPAVVGLFLEQAAGRRLLVSFNGKTFDQPFVRMRAAANGIDCRFDPPHLDLLHAARRLWRGGLPDCRLQTLERCICGRLREGDIPGHLIPDAYHAYVRTGNAAQMVAVIEHNFLDLVTMADLIVRMPARDA